MAVARPRARDLGVLIAFLGILGLIFGAVGLSKANRRAGGKGMAIAGVVLGIVGTLVTIAVLASSSEGPGGGAGTSRMGGCHRYETWSIVWVVAAERPADRPHHADGAGKRDYIGW